jgi:inner membrane protein
LAGAVVADSLLHLSGPALLGASLPADPHQAADQLVLKGIFYAFAALGALTPDIDNARSTLGKRFGFVSRGIQHIAGHRTFFHSLIGLLVVGAFIWGAQYALGWGLYDLGFHRAGIALGAGSGPELNTTSIRGVALIALLLGYLLHLVADSLTVGGVPWLWPNPVRLGFPPERTWRFKSGSASEPVVVVAVAVLVVVAIFFGVLRI